MEWYALTSLCSVPLSSNPSFVISIDCSDRQNAVYDKWIIPGKPPCRACVGAVLGSPNYMVEVRVIAAQ